VSLNQLIKVFGIKGRGIDTEGTRASRIAEEIIKRFVVETKCSMNTENMLYNGPIQMEPLALVIIWPCEVDARVKGAQRVRRRLV